MGSLTFKVDRWRLGSQLREEFLVPVAEAGDKERVKVIIEELRKIRDRIWAGDTKIYSDTLGCWIQVTEE